MTDLQSLPSGTVLVDDYRVERVLGAGGFGVTYLASELEVDRYVTIKEYFPSDFATRNKDLEAVPRSHSSRDDYQWGLDRFIDEARALGKFDHVNIVKLYRYFKANNTAYMVLHFEEGQSLKSWLNGLGRAPRQKELDQLVGPLLDALAIIHGADFLHRDIAPDNIIIRTDGSPVLIDFGSARGEIAHHTRTISALVKPGYSPYEQYAETGKKQGPWTDIYAFAGTLYHAVTGKRPPDAPSRVIKDELKPALDAAGSKYRDAFLKAIDRGLQLDIDSRPQTIAAWRSELLKLPDTENTRWFERWSGRANDKNADEAPLTRPTRKLTEIATTPLPPDVPQPEGGFVDFVQRLKQRNRQSDDAEAAPQSSSAERPAADPPAADIADKAAANQAPDERRDQQAKRLRLGWGMFARANAAHQAPTPEGIAEATADEPSEQRPVSVPERTAPRLFRKSGTGGIQAWSGRHLAGLVFKLLIGIGVASAVVAVQNRNSKIEGDRTGTRAGGGTTTASATKQKDLQDVPAREAKRPPNPTHILLHKFQAHDGAVTKTAFAKAGQLIVTTGADGVMKVWDTASQTLERAFELEDGPATALATRGDLALTGHSEGVIALWDLTTSNKRQSYKRNEASIWSLAFADNADRFWSASHDWTLALWETAAPSAPVQVIQGHGNAVQAIAFSPARTLLASGGADKSIKVWKADSLRLERTYRKTRDFVTALAFSPNGRLLAAGMLDGRMRVMSTRSRRYRETGAHDGAVVAIRFTDDSHLLTASKDGALRIWQRGWRSSSRINGSPPAGSPVASAPLTAIDVSPDGQLIVAADAGGNVHVWRNAARQKNASSR